MKNSRTFPVVSRDEFLAAILGKPDPKGTAAFVAAITGERDVESAAAVVLREYNPDEARDWRGRWTVDGASSAGAQPGYSLSGGSGGGTPYVSKPKAAAGNWSAPVVKSVGEPYKGNWGESNSHVAWEVPPKLLGSPGHIIQKISVESTIVGSDGTVSRDVPLGFRSLNPPYYEAWSFDSNGKISPEIQPFIGEPWHDKTDVPQQYPDTSGTIKITGEAKAVTDYALPGDFKRSNTLRLPWSHTEPRGWLAAPDSTFRTVTITWTPDGMTNVITNPR